MTATVLVLGGRSEIGLEVARRLAPGATVVLAARRSTDLDGQERDLRAGLAAERRQLEARARDAVEVSEQAQADAMDARNLVGELRARLRGALQKTAAPETEPPPEPPASACPY